MAETKGAKTKIFHGFLTYTPKSCPKCNCINKDHMILLNGISNVIVKLKLLKLVITILFFF